MRRRRPKLTFFTFIWKIENFSLSVTGDKSYFCSPSYKLDSEEFELGLGSHRKEIIEIQIIKPNTYRKYPFTFKFELSFHPLGEEDDFNIRGLLVGLKKGLHLPLDTLTIYCRIPQYHDIPSSQYLAHTTFLKETFLWEIENFNDSKEMHTTFELDSLHFDIELLKREPTDTTQRKTSRSVIESNYNMIMKQTDGDKLRSANYEVTIMVPDKSILYGITGQLHPELVGNPLNIPLYVKNESVKDTLTIHIQFLFEVNKMSSEEPEAVCDRPSCSRSAMIRIMLEGNKSLWNHKSEQEMLEKILEYFPTDSVGELQLEWAAKLQCLADKYNLKGLKEKCLSLSNVCKALVLADSNEDDDLMRSVMDYICDHDDVIFSKEWKTLEVDDPRLTTKAFREMYMRKVKKAVVPD